MNHLSHRTLNPVTLRLSALFAALVLASAFASSAYAANLCVDQQGKAGCFSTISAAVAAAATGDTINVNPGVYHEDVVITNSLSLVGHDRESTIIDATGLSNGIYVNGFYNGVSEVLVTGFTVRNANFEGILANDADALTVFNNIVMDNDQSLRPSSQACPGLPAFETSENNDCGEGIHLIGSTHTTVVSNIVKNNAGGILISDETSTSHDNTISRNVVEFNPYACGITLASHPAYFAPGEPQPSGTLAFGIYNNLILNNETIHNGFGGQGGSGIGLFAPGVQNRVYANSVVGNRVVRNGHAGITIHTHLHTTSGAKNPDASRNAIVGNFLSRNGADPDIPTAGSTGIAILGVSPVIDTTVSGNVIDDEDIAVAFSSASTLDLHLNEFLAHGVGVANYNAEGNINALENWWGCSTGPGSHGCSTIVGSNVTFSPWLTGADELKGNHLEELLHDLNNNHDEHSDR